MGKIIKKLKSLISPTVVEAEPSFMPSLTAKLSLDSPALYLKMSAGATADSIIATEAMVNDAVSNVSVAVSGPASHICSPGDSITPSNPDKTTFVNCWFNYTLDSSTNYAQAIVYLVKDGNMTPTLQWWENDKTKSLSFEGNACLSFVVPAGYAYQIMGSGGTSTAISCYEFSL